MSFIYVDADHRGYKFKKKLVEFLRDSGFEVTDLGKKNLNEDDDYSDIAIKLAEKVVKDNTKGILICGSGVGINIAANKVDGARAALCGSVKQVRLGREDDDMNILCLSAELVDEETNLEMAKVFLETIFFAEERFIRRINKIKEYERTKLS